MGIAETDKNLIVYSLNPSSGLLNQQIIPIQYINQDQVDNIIMINDVIQKSCW